MDDKAQRSKDVSTQERDLLMHKSIVSETIQESTGITTARLTSRLNNQNQNLDSLESPTSEKATTPTIKTLSSEDPSSNKSAPGYSPPTLDDRLARKTLTVVNADGELEEVELSFTENWVLEGFIGL